MATTYARIQLLSKSSANFTQNDPVLLDGELGISDSGSSSPVVKIGDGVRPWSMLPPVGGTPSVGPGLTWTPAGNYNISAPATGSTLALQGNAGGPALDVSGGAGNTDPADTVVRFTQTSGPGALLTLKTQTAIGSTVIAASPTGYAPGAAPCAFALFTEPTVPSIILQAFGAAATLHLGGAVGVVIDPPLTSGPALSISNLATDKALVISGSVANTQLVKVTGTAGGNALMYLVTVAATDATSLVLADAAGVLNLAFTALPSTSIYRMALYGAGTSLHLTAPSGVVIDAPSGGAAFPTLTITGPPNGIAARFTDASTYGLDIQHSAAGTGPLFNADANNTLHFGVGGSEFVTIGPAGAAIFSPTGMPAAVTIGGSGGNALNVAGGQLGAAVFIASVPTVGNSKGLRLCGGTNNTDWPLWVQNQAGSLNILKIRGDGTMVYGVDIASGALVEFTGDTTNGPLVLIENTAGPNPPLVLRTLSTGGTAFSCNPNAPPGQAACAFSIFCTPADPSIGLYTFGTNAMMKLSAPAGIVVQQPTAAFSNAFSVNGAAGVGACFISSPNTAGQSKGLNVTAGTNNTDWSLWVNNAAGASLMKVFGDGGTGHGALGSMGAATINCAGVYVNSAPHLAVNGSEMRAALASIKSARAKFPGAGASLDQMASALAAIFDSFQTLDAALAEAA